MTNLAFRSDIEPLKELYDQGNVAIIHGIGFENSPRSHFRAMDIWHTCEPDSIGINGWLAKVVRDLDPGGENVLKGVNLGQGSAPGAGYEGSSRYFGKQPAQPTACCHQIRPSPPSRTGPGCWRVLPACTPPAIGSGPTMDYLGQAGRDALKGADIIRVAPQAYSSTVEYANNPIARRLRDVAQVHLAGLGAQVFYTAYGSFDTHYDQMGSHTKLVDGHFRRPTRFFRRPARARCLGRGGGHAVQ